MREADSEREKTRVYLCTFVRCEMKYLEARLCCSRNNSVFAAVASREATQTDRQNIAALLDYFQFIWTSPNELAAEYYATVMWLAP